MAGAMKMISTSVLLVLLNGGSAYSPYNVNWIPLTSDPMPAVFLSDLKIQIPLS